MSQEREECASTFLLLFLCDNIMHAYAEEFQYMHSRLMIFQQISTVCSGSVSSTLVNMQHLCMSVLYLFMYGGMYAFMYIYVQCAIYNVCLGYVCKGILSYKMLTTEMYITESIVKKHIFATIDFVL